MAIRTRGICTTHNHQGEWDAQTCQGFWDTKRSPNSSQTTRPCDSHHQQKKNEKKKERICRRVKESEKSVKYLDLAKEQKTMQHENDGDTNCDWCIWANP